MSAIILTKINMGHPANFVRNDKNVPGKNDLFLLSVSKVCARLICTGGKCSGGKCPGGIRPEVSVQGVHVRGAYLLEPSPSTYC